MRATKLFAANFCLGKGQGRFLPQSDFYFVVVQNTQARTHRSPLVPFFFSTCQDTFSAASLTASSSQGEEPLTSPQIWLVAKIRPVRELKSSLQLHWPGKSWPAGLHLRLSVSRRKRWKNNQGTLAWSYLPSSAALQNSSCLQSVWISLIPVNYMLN